VAKIQSDRQIHSFSSFSQICERHANKALRHVHIPAFRGSSRNLHCRRCAPFYLTCHETCQRHFISLAMSFAVSTLIFSGGLSINGHSFHGKFAQCANCQMKTYGLVILTTLFREGNTRGSAPNNHSGRLTVVLRRNIRLFEDFRQHSCT
jgi:hypothetical protein